MSINVRTKGQVGEREIADALNQIVVTALTERGASDEMVERGRRCVQRNQMQSAVGGADLVGTFGLAIEVKRQETLSVTKWWQQCVTQAARNNEMPVLIYRQNRKPWRVRMHVSATTIGGSYPLVGEISWDDFKELFLEIVRANLAFGYEIRS